jgi:dihydroflavonol-4-reductase
VRVFLTGGTGFIGGHVARKLRERGDDVAALARSPEKGAALTELGCELISGDLSDETAIATGLRDADAAIHGAAVYEVGIPEREHAAMYEANVVGTENVLRAALVAKTPKIVYISTVAAFGNTHGEVVDESYEHPGREFTSYYEQTKFEAHRVAEAPDRRGGPAVRDRPARRRLRARRPLGARQPDEPVPRRADAAPHFP